MKKISLPVFAIIVLLLSQRLNINSEKKITRHNRPGNKRRNFGYLSRAAKKLLDQIDNGIIILNPDAPAYTGRRQAPGGSVNFYFLPGNYGNSMMEFMVNKANTSIIVCPLEPGNGFNQKTGIELQGRRHGAVI